MTGSSAEAIRRRRASLEPALRGEGGCGTIEVEQSPEAVKLGLEEPLGIIEGVGTQNRNDGRDSGQWRDT
jgi:hypothetical protein